MSNSERKANLAPVIQTCESQFAKLARVHGVPDFTFAREAAFALQALKQNDYLATVACGNQDSLKDAIINVAAVGLSLSPVHKLAYLVPRKRRVCLDISWVGLVDLSVSAGSIVWAKPALVHDNDQFEYMGPNIAPIHKFDHRKPRGEIVGVYTTAKLACGDLLIDYMSIQKVLRIRDKYSEGYKAAIKDGTSTPWLSDDDEMIMKTSVRHAFKTWPKSKSSPAITKALEVLDDSSGEVDEPLQLEEPTPHLVEGFEIIREFLEVLERPEEKFIAHLCKSTNRKIEKIEDLTQLEVDQAITFLQSLVDGQAARLNKFKKEQAHEDAG